MKKVTSFLFVLLFSTAVFAQQFSAVDTIIENAIKKHITPGAALIVGTPEKILYQKAYGHYTYDPASKEVNLQSMFDMASCTKVFATTTCMMKLVDEGKIDIETPVKNFLPDFAQNGKGDVKVRNLLLHNSGLPAYYTPKAGETPKDIFNKIFALKFAYKTDSNMVYSCLNFVSTMKVIEAVTGMPMYKYYKENFTDPLGMTRTMFTPSEEYKKDCLPATDSLQGVVHDPLARGLKGLSGNAGLFSTVGDLAKICQVLLGNGVYQGKRYFKEETVKEFTTRYSAASSRALGWDTKSLQGYSSAGKLFSAKSFGHTGYTGTSVWMDPERKIFVILLTNRVYPDDKANVGPVRSNVADAVVRALEENPSAAGN
ncbi:MAG: serine hydrolase [Ignavibacteria bacterium]|jgi:CubicO group peptidase (beta-lactamase class C family)|nr:serine hydrolase [Ignavibacteria bacterium]MCU7504793.1 serine hydrolase [Ignavibacteria bacterium]MCU7517679.1 serine hydrolase [Ignavibacteria bacterium]